MSTRTQCRPDLRTNLDVPTAIHTNTTFMANRGDEFEGDQRVRSYAEARARAAGVSPMGKRFTAGLCRDGVPFDPRAWIDTSNAKSEIKRRCIDLGREAHDGLKTIVKARDLDGPLPTEKPYRCNDGIVQRALREELNAMKGRGEPLPDAEGRRELAEKLRAHHSGD